MFRATDSPILRALLTVYTAFGTTNRQCCRPVEMERSSISTVAPDGSIVGLLYTLFEM